MYDSNIISLAVQTGQVSGFCLAVTSVMWKIALSVPTIKSLIQLNIYNLSVTDEISITSLLFFKQMTASLCQLRSLLWMKSSVEGYGKDPIPSPHRSGSLDGLQLTELLCNKERSQGWIVLLVSSEFILQTGFSQHILLFLERKRGHQRSTVTLILNATCLQSPDPAMGHS